jgi:hypothetical protein
VVKLWPVVSHRSSGLYLGDSSHIEISSTITPQPSETLVCEHTACLVWYDSQIADAFVITCTITSNGAPPAPPPAVPKQTVPRDLMNSISSLLDDPLYSDVEFVFPRPEGAAKRIYAASKLLKRCDYFDSSESVGAL